MSKILTANRSNAPFEGWASFATIPLTAITQESFTIDGVPFQVGRKTSRLAKSLWAKLSNNPGDERDFDMAAAVACPPTAPPTKEDLLAIGGVPTISGAPLDFISIVPDGPSFLAHFRRRLGLHFGIDLWVWYAHGNKFMPFRLLPWQSNCALPDLMSACPIDLVFEWGSHSITMIGKLPLAGETYGVDQAQGCIGTISLPGGEVSAASYANFPQQILCDEWATQLPPFGKPNELPVAFSEKNWVIANLDRLRANAGTWVNPRLGPSNASGDTGAQEDEDFSKMGEEFDFDQADKVTGALFVRYLAAITMARRPNNKREANGAPLEWRNHPNLILFNGQVDTRIQRRDTLGKVFTLPKTSITTSDTMGSYYGPDREHFLINEVADVSLLTGDPLCQDILRNHFQTIMLGETINSVSTSTNGPGAARGGGGWVPLAMSLLLNTLESTQDQLDLQQRISARVAMSLMPVYRKPWEHAGWFDTTTATNYMAHHPGSDKVSVVWQHSICAMGMAALWEATNVMDCMTLAIQAARFVLRYGWKQDAATGIWFTVDTVGITNNELDGSWYHGTVSFATWCSAAVSVILRYVARFPQLTDGSILTEADIDKARSIYDQQHRAGLAGTQPLSWLVPLS